MWVVIPSLSHSLESPGTLLAAGLAKGLAKVPKGPGQYWGNIRVFWLLDQMAWAWAAGAPLFVRNRLTGGQQLCYSIRHPFLLGLVWRLALPSHSGPRKHLGLS